MMPLAVLALALAAGPARPAHDHGPQHSIVHVRPQDEVTIVTGPLAGVRVRVLALQHKFFDAEVWAECLAMEPDTNGHLHWLLVPVCALDRVGPPLS